MSISGEIFSQRLKALMQKRNLSAADVARHMRTTSSTVFGWLKGTMPRKRAMEDLAKLLQVPLESFGGLSDSEFVNEISQTPDSMILQEDPVPCRVQARDDLLTLENIALMGGANARMLLNRMFDKAKEDLAYYQRNAGAINHLVDYLKTNPEP